MCAGNNDKLDLFQAFLAIFSKPNECYIATFSKYYSLTSHVSSLQGIRGHERP